MAKSRVLIYAIVILLSGFCLCSAAPCYGTRMPGRQQFASGIQSYAIFKRYLEDDYGKMRSSQYFLLLSYGVFDWLAIDLKGGAGNIKQRPVGRDEIDYTGSFAGGYGARLKFFEKDKARVVLGFQHISVHPKSCHQGQIKHKAILDDWQWSLVASYDVGRLSPYLGTRWSRLDYIHWDNGVRKRAMSDRTKDVGLIAGLDLSLGKKAWVNLEGQFLDSEAVAFSLNIEF